MNAITYPWSKLIHVDLQQTLHSSAMRVIYGMTARVLRDHLCTRPANGRQRYNVILSPIGWAHTQNDPWGLLRFQNPVFASLLPLLHCITYAVSCNWLIVSQWRHMATKIWVNTGSGNGLLPDGTKPLPEPMLTYHQQRTATFIWGQVHKRYVSQSATNP